MCPSTGTSCLQNEIVGEKNNVTKDVIMKSSVQSVSIFGSQKLLQER